MLQNPPDVRKCCTENSCNLRQAQSSVDHGARDKEFREEILHKLFRIYPPHTKKKRITALPCEFRIPNSI